MDDSVENKKKKMVPPKGKKKWIEYQMENRERVAEKDN